MKTKQERKQEKVKAAAGSAPSKSQRMNRKQRRELARKIQADDVSLEVVHPDAAGIDIGNECHYVAVPSKRDPEQPLRRFGCVTAELKTMAEWLKQCRIRTVAMQSTGVYWIPVYDILEAAGLEVYLVNARETQESAGQENGRAGKPMADEAAHLWTRAEFLPADGGDPKDEELLAAAERSHPS
jgi:hypothetical protein